MTEPGAVKVTSNPARDVRDAINRVDETPFGQIGKLFDRMADDAQRSINERNHLIEVLDGLVLVCGRTGDAFYDFEEQAAAFHEETGWMRPGKDVGVMMADSPRSDDQSRRVKYAAWVQMKIEAGRKALSDETIERKGAPPSSTQNIERNGCNK